MEPVSSRLVTMDEMLAARDRIHPHVVRTPICSMSRTGLLLKPENLQPSGSFKLRAAFNNLLRLPRENRSGGVVAHSSGNHAVAVAYACSTLGIPVAIVMPEDAPRVKIMWTASLGAELIIVGPASRTRAERAYEIARERSWPIIEPYDSIGVVEATSSIAIEIYEDLHKQKDEPLDIYVPSSGGGLVSGIAAVVKLLDTSWRVIAVEPEIAANALASRMAGERVTLPAEQMSLTLADGLRVQRLGEVNWHHIEAFVDEIVTVDEVEIRHAMKIIAEEARLIAEPSGAVSVAAALTGRAASTGDARDRLAVVSGGNVDMAMFADILSAQYR